MGMFHIETVIISERNKISMRLTVLILVGIIAMVDSLPSNMFQKRDCPESTKPACKTDGNTWIGEPEFAICRCEPEVSPPCFWLCKQQPHNVPN